MWSHQSRRAGSPVPRWRRRGAYSPGIAWAGKQIGLDGRRSDQEPRRDACPSVAQRGHAPTPAERLLPQCHGFEGLFHGLEDRQPHDLAFAEGPNVSGVGHRFDSALPADPNKTNRNDDLVSRVDEIVGLHPPRCPLLPNELQELPDSFMTAKDEGVKGPPGQVINDVRVEDAVVHLATTVEV